MKEKTKNILAVLSAAFMSFVGILTETSLNVTFPTMMKQFNVALATVQWTTTGYLLTIAIIMICSSYLNERFTAKQLFVVACGGFMVGSVISAFAPNFSDRPYFDKFLPAPAPWKRNPELQAIGAAYL